MFKQLYALKLRTVIFLDTQLCKAGDSTDTRALSPNTHAYRAHGHRFFLTYPHERDFYEQLSSTDELQTYVRV